MESEGPGKSPYNGDPNQNETRNKHQYHYSQFSVAGSLSPTTSTAAQLGESNDTDRRKISCNSCRQRKIKCDRGNPCNQCASSFYGTVEIPSWENWGADLLRLPVRWAFSKTKKAKTFFGPDRTPRKQDKSNGKLYSIGTRNTYNGFYPHHHSTCCLAQWD